MTDSAEWKPSWIDSSRAINMRLIWALASLALFLDCLAGCAVTVAETAGGKEVRGISIEITADDDVKAAAFDHFNAQGVRYRFAQACLEEHGPEDCQAVMGFIESFREVPRGGVAGPE
jgi:hypothetical protein